MKSVLLINTSSEPAARLMQERAGIQLSVITTPSYRRFYADDADVVVVESVEDLTQVRHAALEIRRRNPFAYVVSPSELSLQAGGYIRSYFGLPGAGYEVANAFSNKHVMKQRLAAAGLPVARFQQLSQFTDASEAARTLGWPVVVKPAIGGGSEDVFVLRDEAQVRDLATAELTAQLRESPYPMVAEEFVDIEAEFHCDAVVVGGEVHFAAVSRYFSPVLKSVGELVGSYTLPAGHPDAVAVAEQHAAAVKALGLSDGVTHLEVLKCSRGYLIGEVACRPGGGGIAEQLLHQYGVDIWMEFLATSLDDPVAGVQLEPEDHLIQYMLPRPPGTITHISTAEDLLQVPGVVYADVRATTGDSETGVVHSATFAGLVLVRADSEEQVQQRIAAVGTHYKIDVHTEEG
ncbi:ATP-grasp domain-containing protein [Streptomyces sp. NBC_00190]|uniref:ATP-grasp domain-containing protein n=1 Tax=Streptomyces sp. NBC_00190 TaxID=2903634 RepID=UPI002E27C022|nr:ATP-grasp domain-containing protein [Streptomyces sp. NBC_00190]